MQQSLTLSKSVWPAYSRDASPVKWAARNVALAVVFSALIGLCAHVQFKLGFTPVPITGQTFGVLLTAALLGPRLGVATLLLYVGEGCLGLPVFASIGSIASCGYLAGFVLAAGAVGALAERGWDRKPLTTAAMMACGSALIYACGVVWLARYVGGYGHAIYLGVLPFLIGDVVKAAAASALLPIGWQLVGKSSRPIDRAS
jgi:biotin transport system substrate-specific component